MYSLKKNSVKVDCKRNGTRFACEHECNLHHNGAVYACQMKNISISGALVSAENFPPEAIQIGDTCALSLSNDVMANPGRYTSKITRLESNKIGVRFLSIAF
ncbi:MAG: PilZ domain-containing protein [Desulfuromonadaceae bacterium]|nr:PilZ domain-containing protein [Desulfuromonadaceae bacterium]MDD5106005.1 PilZ domain-containing protein [Desulfuromonadaceae bacterium]